MITVLLSNNYGLDAARAGWAAGRYPSHHLFGTARLPDGMEVVDLAERPTTLAGRLGTRAGGRLGELDQQAELLRRARRADHPVAFSANLTTLRGVAALKGAGALRGLPLVGVCHFVPALPAPVRRRMLAGFDALITMGRSVATQLADEHGIDPARIHPLPWGPDLAFAGFADAPAPSDDGLVVSTGKAERDPATLLRALAIAGLPGRVYVADPADVAGVRVPAGVELVPAVPRTPQPGPLTYDHVLGDLHRASVVAICLRGAVPYQGLTELADAIGAGRPVVMTDVPYIDLDLEAIGCGHRVPREDPEALAAALLDVVSTPGRAAAMGERGRAWAREHWSAERFADGLAGVLAGVTT